MTKLLKCFSPANFLSDFFEHWKNSSSFGFAKGGLVCRAKPNVLKCVAGKEKIKNAGRQKF